MTTMQTPAHKRFLTPIEAAEELGVSRSSIYRACEEGALPHVQLRPNGALRIPADALEPERHREDER
jgi:excisionase family DNA binding protein